MMMQRRVWGSIRWVTSKRTTGEQKGRLLRSCSSRRPGAQRKASCLARGSRLNPLGVASFGTPTTSEQEDEARGAQTPEMPQTAASQVTGAKRTDGASASCTQHASILRLLGVHAREAADVLLWQPSCGRKPSRPQPMAAMLCKKPPAVTSPLNSEPSQRKSIRRVRRARSDIRGQSFREHPACEDIHQITWPAFAVSLDKETNSPESTVVVW